jgi:putative DNA primase/helicase
MDADLSRIAFIDGATEIVDGELRKVAFDPAKHLPALALRVAQEPPALVIIDPIVSAVAGDSHKNSETRRGLQPLVDLARLHDFALFGVTHFSKGTQGRDPTERVTGSLAFGALARMVFVATKTREGRVFMKSKSNIATDEGGFGYDIEQTQVPNYPDIFASRVLWGAAIEGNAREVLAEAEAEEQTDGGGNESTETDEAVEALRDVLSDGEIVAKEAKATMRAAGYTDKVIRLARERLGVLVRRQGFGIEMKSLWSLPPDIDLENVHSCPQAPFVPSNPNSETRARMDTEGTNGADPVEEAVTT